MFENKSDSIFPVSVSYDPQEQPNQVTSKPADIDESTHETEAPEKTLLELSFELEKLKTSNMLLQQEVRDLNRSFFSKSYDAVMGNSAWLSYQVTRPRTFSLAQLVAFTFSLVVITIFLVSLDAKQS